MKLRFVPLIAALLFPLSAFSQAPVSTEHAAEIQKLLALTGANNNSAEMANSLIQQLVGRMSAANPNLPAAVPEIITDVVSKFVSNLLASEEMSDATTQIYAKHFSLEEIKSLNTFYSSDLGKKLSTSLPALTNESIQASQQIFQKRSVELQTELQKRLADAGVK